MLDPVPVVHQSRCSRKLGEFPYFGKASGQGDNYTHTHTHTFSQFTHLLVFGLGSCLRAQGEPPYTNFTHRLPLLGMEPTPGVAIAPSLGRTVGILQAVSAIRHSPKLDGCLSDKQTSSLDDGLGSKKSDVPTPAWPTTCHTLKQQTFISKRIHLMLKQQMDIKKSQPGLGVKGKQMLHLQ